MTDDTHQTADDHDGSEPRTIRVYCPNPSAGPVHVDQGAPLLHPDTRSVTDSPLIQAYLAGGLLAIAPDTLGAETPKTPARRGRAKETT